MIFGISLVCLLGLLIPQPVLKDRCVLDSAQNGDIVKIRGVFRGASYPGYVNPEGCPANEDNLVVLISGDNSLLGESMIPVQRDEAYSEFERLASEEVESTDTWICLHCPKWEITADFEGRLDKLPRAGWVRDEKTDKMIGREGFGSMTSVSRYRLVYTRISNIEAVESGIRAPISEGE